MSLMIPRQHASFSPTFGATNPGGPYFSGRIKTEKEALKKSVDEFAHGSVNGALAASSISGPFHAPLSGVSFGISAFYNVVEGIKKLIDGSSTQDDSKKGDIQ
jgi:hypothetical protein